MIARASAKGLFLPGAVKSLSVIPGKMYLENEYGVCEPYCFSTAKISKYQA